MSQPNRVCGECGYPLTMDCEPGCDCASGDPTRYTLSQLEHAVREARREQLRLMRRRVYDLIARARGLPTKAAREAYTDAIMAALREMVG